ncbi:hypothetical protein EV127DRAFT_338216, partial [Xylaria flabelliformis]
QVAASNANLASFFPPSGTGGSWKKSPVITSWMPPKARPFFRMSRAICESLSNRSPSTMETSSIMSVLVRSHLFFALAFRRIFFTRVGTSSFPSPMPAKL